MDRPIWFFGPVYNGNRQRSNTSRPTLDPETRLDAQPPAQDEEEMMNNMGGEDDLADLDGADDDDSADSDDEKMPNLE